MLASVVVGILAGLVALVLVLAVALVVLSAHETWTGQNRPTAPIVHRYARGRRYA